ncbi:hypothetical protein CLOBOL_05312 [Enterocloster bolteae ATCC BAA-613]|uniref:Uncharacterized protein n=1 Tax=Enterocloster bolteae (strain ATCC BAA-613 / DSM 15670 / CCUG 46953 / JCM 12243 / WAL 16351) TaxID=411902 RepID=A8RZ37_ENTBW|nr:hypothetical protein CLOBOL_05312 [Enterocloster bolteae ATCC BAA-613]
MRIFYCFNNIIYHNYIHMPIFCQLIFYFLDISTIIRLLFCLI